MAKFKNIQTGNVLVVTDPTAARMMEESPRYERVYSEAVKDTAKAKKPAKRAVATADNGR